MASVHLDDRQTDVHLGGRRIPRCEAYRYLGARRTLAHAALLGVTHLKEQPAYRYERFFYAFSTAVTTMAYPNHAFTRETRGLLPKSADTIRKILRLELPESANTDHYTMHWTGTAGAVHLLGTTRRRMDLLPRRQL